MFAILAVFEFLHFPTHGNTVHAVMLSLWEQDNEMLN